LEYRKAGFTPAFLFSLSDESFRHVGDDGLQRRHSPVTFPATAIAVSRADDIHPNVDMATARISYKFGGPVIAKY
jgi:hypothetical protein